MLLAATTTIDGNLDQLLKVIDQGEQKTGKYCAWILCAGNLGAWLDPAKLPEKCSKEFAQKAVEGWSCPRNILFVPGPYDDNVWIQSRYAMGNTELISNIHCLMPGYQTHIGDMHTDLSVTGMGRTYSYNRFSANSSAPLYKNYVQSDIERACSHLGTDLFISFLGPRGESFGTRVSNGEGITECIAALKPKLAIHGGYNYSRSYTMGTTEIVSLAQKEVMFFEYENSSFIPLFSEQWNKGF